MAFIPGDYASLNNAVFDALHSSISLTIGFGVAKLPGNQGYFVSAVSGQLASFDNWNGLLGSPDDGDIVSITTSTSGNPFGVLTYFQTLGNGDHAPATGGIGAQVVAFNSTGVLLQQLDGYVPGSSPTIKPNGTYFMLSLSNLSYTDGSGGPGTGDLAFLPEPSMVLLMPAMIAGLLIARMPAVRGFLRSF